MCRIDLEDERGGKRVEAWKERTDDIKTAPPMGKNEGG
jgi:hypothetical protein